MITGVSSGFGRAHGPIDVRANNAGYGHEGIFEESPCDEMRRQFGGNGFAAVRMIKAVLPAFRAHRRDHVISVASMGGYIALPSIAYYCGGQFALEGFSDTLNNEPARFDIHVTAVKPGSLPTDWAGRSIRRSPRRIADHDASLDPVRQARKDRSGHQPGDPVKAAKAMLRVIDSDALALVRDRLAGNSREILGIGHRRHGRLTGCRTRSPGSGPRRRGVRRQIR